MWPHPSPEKYDFDELESTLSKVAFTKVAHFLRKCFFFKYFFSIYYYVKIYHSPLCPHPTPRDHDHAFSSDELKNVFFS